MTIENECENHDFKIQTWKTLKWQPSNDQLQQLITLQNLLRKLNKRVNLTRLIEGNDFWVSQILDSLWPFQNELKNNSQALKIIDVGTGCGLPGLAIAIALPKSSVTLVDSISKKTNAIKSIVADLGLEKRVEVRTERIESTGQNMAFRYGFDRALARAVAEGPVLAEYLMPLLNSSGKAILYKGKWTSSDYEKLIQALSVLNGKIEKISSLKLPENRGTRHAISIVLNGTCPMKYPRAIGIPSKKPL